MPLVKMDATLGEDYGRRTDLSQNKASGVSGHRRFGQFSKFGVGNAIFRFGIRNEKVQTGTEHEGDVGVPGAQSTKSGVTHSQAAEIGGADSGFRTPAITSGRTLSSRIGVIFASCLG